MSKPLTQLSKRRYATCDERWHYIIETVNSIVPLYVMCGFRGEKAQNTAYNTGKSGLMWPNSKHNHKKDGKECSLAIDFAPRHDPVNWDNISEFKIIADLIIAVGQAKGIKIEWGGNWTNLKDYGHVEIVD